MVKNFTFVPLGFWVFAKALNPMVVFKPRAVMSCKGNV